MGERTHEVADYRFVAVTVPSMMSSMKGDRCVGVCLLESLNGKNDAPPIVSGQLLDGEHLEK